MKADLPPLDTAQRYTISEATQYLRISRPTLRKQIRDGLVPAIAEGRRVFIPGSVIADRSRLPD